jgi:APA family basic amino acid/polyamine antiporter
MRQVESNEPHTHVLAAFYLMLNLPAATWIRFGVWMVLGFVVYFIHRRRHSRLATDPNHSREADAAAASRRKSSVG